MTDLFKNPVSIGVFAGLLTYFYLVWDKRNEIERAKKNKKYKVNKKVDILIPALVAIVVWFIAYLYFNKDSQNKNISVVSGNNVINPVNNIIDVNNNPKTYRLVTDSSTKVEDQLTNQLSYTLITNNKGITLPDGLHANMFIEKL